MNSFLLGIGSLLLVVLTFGLWFKLAFHQSLPKNPTGFLLAMLVAVSAAVVALFNSPGIAGGVSAVVALLGGALLFFSVYAGPQKAEAEKIQLGKPLPIFSALTENGSNFSSEELHGAPYLLKFFRGHW